MCRHREYEFLNIKVKAIPLAVGNEFTNSGNKVAELHEFPNFFLNDIYNE